MCIPEQKFGKTYRDKAFGDRGREKVKCMKVHCVKIFQHVKQLYTYAVRYATGEGGRKYWLDVTMTLHRSGDN